MKLLIVDDHPIMRHGVGQLVHARWPEAEVTEADSLAAALAALKVAIPDVVVLDLSLPDSSGLESLQRLRRARPELPVLILSMHAESAYAARALQLWASGYVPKDRAVNDLVAALERVLAGGRYISPSLAERLADQLTGRAPAQPPHETLSSQELRVLILLAQGRGVAEIGHDLSLSPKTVSTYRGRLLEKMGLHTNAMGARWNWSTEQALESLVWIMQQYGFPVKRI